MIEKNNLIILKLLFKYKLIFIICFFLLSNRSISNNNIKIDSLKRLINVSASDSNKVNYYIELSRLYDVFKAKEVIENDLNALNLAKKIKYIPGIKKTYNLLITNLFYKGVYDLALAYYYEYASFLKDNNFTDDLIASYNLYGNLLSRQKNYKEALKYYHLAKAFHLSNNNYTRYAGVLNNLSLLNIEIKHYDSALIYSYRAIEIYQKNNVPANKANSILGVAEIFILKGDYKSAKIRATESYDIYKNINEIHGISNSLFVLGNVYSHLREDDTALALMKNSLRLAKELHIKEVQRDCYSGISKIYERQRKFKEAYDNQILFKTLSDSILNDNLQSKMMEMEVKYDIANKKAQIKEIEFEIDAKNRQQYFLLSVIIAVLILLGFSFNAYKQKKKVNIFISEQKKIVEDKQKEILDSINYAKRIQKALLPQDKYIERVLNNRNKP